MKILEPNQTEAEKHSLIRFGITVFMNFGIIHNLHKDQAIIVILQTKLFK